MRGCQGQFLVEQPIRRGKASVEEFGTLVPFSNGLHATSFVREQFWGRAARASLTRKSRGACFIFPIDFHFYRIRLRQARGLREKVKTQ